MLALAAQAGSAQLHAYTRDAVGSTAIAAVGILLQVLHAGAWELQNALDLLRTCMCKLQLSGNGNGNGNASMTFVKEQLQGMTQQMELYARALAGPVGRREFKY